MLPNELKEKAGCPSCVCTVGVIYPSGKVNGKLAVGLPTETSLFGNPWSLLAHQTL